METGKWYLGAREGTVRLSASDPADLQMALQVLGWDSKERVQLIWDMEVPEAELFCLELPAGLFMSSSVAELYDYTINGL